MLIEFPVDPNEVDYINTKLTLVTHKLTIALMLLLQELHEADRKKEAFVGKGMDADAVRQTAEKAQRAKDEHERIFAQPQEEIDRNKQFEADVTAARKELRW